MNSKRHARLRQHQAIRKEARRLTRLMRERLEQLLQHERIRYDVAGYARIREIVTQVLTEENYY